MRAALRQTGTATADSVSWDRFAERAVGDAPCDSFPMRRHVRMVRLDLKRVGRHELVERSHEALANLDQIGSCAGAIAPAQRRPRAVLLQF